MPVPSLNLDLDTKEVARIQTRTARWLMASQMFSSGATSLGLSVSSILAAAILGSSTWAGLPNSARVLGGAVFSLLLSNYMARAGRRRGLALGLVTGAVGAVLTVASAATSNFSLLLLGSFIFGAGYGASLLTRYAAADLAPASQRGKAISLVVWGSTVGAVVGPNVLGVSGDWAEGLKLPALAGPFGVSAIVFLASATLLFVTLRPDPLLLARRLALRELSAGADGRRPLAELLLRPGVPLALIALMTSQMVMVAIMSMTPVYMRDHGHSLRVVGLVVSAHVLGMYALSPLTGWLCDRIGRIPLVLLSIGTFIFSSLLDGLAPAGSQTLLMFGLFLLGLGWNFGFVAGSALLTDATDPAHRAQMQGFADMVMGLAAALGSLGSGLVLEMRGYPTLNAYGASLVALPLVALWLRRRSSHRFTPSS
ncbi:MAG: MFS transporter [Chloroflexota bacterium]|nr:MFS transporter [Chloroflexota bacterium]